LYAVQYLIFTQKTNHTHILNSYFLFIWICSVLQCFQYVAHTGCFPTKRDEADKAFTRVHGRFQYFVSFEKVVRKRESTKSNGHAYTRPRARYVDKHLFSTCTLTSDNMKAECQRGHQACCDTHSVYSCYNHALNRATLYRIYTTVFPFCLGYSANGTYTSAINISSLIWQKRKVVVLRTMFKY